MDHNQLQKPIQQRRDTRQGNKRSRSTLVGVGVGLMASFSWALYNVGIEIGRQDGFSPADLAILRYIVPAIALPPIMYWTRSTTLQNLTIARAIVLSLLVGPVFALLTNTGYRIAPLAHAVVISPGMTMITANVLSRVFDGRPIPLQRIVGMTILLGGLVIISADQTPSKDSVSAVWIGDLLFFTSGCLWGTFTYLMGRWDLSPLPTTAAVSAISLIAFLPIYLIYFSIPDVSAPLALEQIFYQGVLGGCVALLAYTFAIIFIGAGQAAIFPAIVPPIAVLIAIPFTLEWPNGWQWMGVVLATGGLVISLDSIRVRAVRHTTTSNPS